MGSIGYDARSDLVVRASCLVDASNKEQQQRTAFAGLLDRGADLVSPHGHTDNHDVVAVDDDGDGDGDGDGADSTFVRARASRE